MIEEIILTAKESVYSFSLVFMYCLILIIHPIITVSFYETSKHYWEVWASVLLISGVFLTIFLVAPDWILSVLTSIKSLFA